MKFLSTSFIVLILALSASAAHAKCFTATGEAMSDAQSIRKMALSMGWKVGKTSSITAGTFIKGKVTLYPQDRVEVCLREGVNGKLLYQAQSSASGAGEAKWRNTFGKKQ